jgi:hypothetical protein
VADEPWLKYQAAAGPWTKYQNPALPPQKEIANGAMHHDPGQPVGDEKLPGVYDAFQFLKALPGGAGQMLSDVGTMVQHPIDSAENLVKAVPGAVKSGVNAVAHPLDTATKVGDYLKNQTPESAGKTVGGMMAGGAVGKAAGVLGDVVGPSVKALQKPVSPAVRDLASKGVVMTPGQRGGKLASSIEQRATSIPLVGDQIKRARGKATEQWNRSELNDAIKDAGGTAIPAGRTGRDAIAHTESEMGKSYTRVLSKMSADLNSADPSGMTFHQFLNQTKTLASQGLEPQTAKIVNDLIDNKVIMKFGSNGKATGERVKEIQETLRTEIDDLKSGNYQERKAAQALKQVSADMKAMLKRENPKLAQELDGIDRGYAKFKASSKASLYSTKNSGTYTPAQKLRAIRARDKSKDKQRFASGTAHGEKEAEAVESVIGNTEPDSGSAGRIATMEAILGGAGVAAHHPLGAAAVMGGPAMYSQPVLKALQNRALKKGGPYQPVGAKAPIAGAALGAGQVDQNGIGQ